MNFLRRWFPHPGLSALLLLAWLILNGSPRPAQLLPGALLAWLIPLLSDALLGRRVRLYRPLLALRLLLRVLADIVIANLRVARLVLSPVSALRPAFVRVPLDLREPYAIYTLASIVTLTPGTVSSRISEDRRYLLVHALDLDDEQALVAQIKARYELPLKEIFQC